MLPNFLIIGAAKSGTTTLMEYLRQHDEIFIAPREINFFDIDNHYERGMRWYEDHFGEANGHLAIGEKTPSYSYIPQAAERIHQHLPNARLIWVFREPVARAYSNYWHSISRGSERLKFDSAIAAEEERIKDNLYRGYLKRGIYVEQIKRFLEYFPQSQMHFILFEDLVREPEASARGVFEFLGVGPELAITQQPKKVNVTFVPRSITLMWASRRLFRKTPPYWWFRRLNTRSVAGYPPMNKETETRLKEYYRPYNLELSVLIGRDLHVWDT